jgi:phage terminase large subunit GpA-like protein
MSETFTIDLTNIDGEGEFACPKCGETISPEDDSETNYEIKEVETNNNNIEKVVIQCKKCKSRIRLKWFELLKNIGYSEDLFMTDDYLKV